MTSGNASDGALDNAGSVGILLHLAEVLRKSPPRNTTVYFLFTGAEEMGLQGAFAFLRRHGRDMDPEKCWVINLDCLGIQGKTRVICQNGVPFHFQRSPLMKHLVRAASCFSIRFAPITFGVWMDHLPFLAQGYPAVSLTCFTPKILSVHSSRDTIDHLDPAGAEEPGRFLLALLRGLDDRPPPGALSRTGPGGRADG
jgi:Zn-dependent M28 family amino/carboxypeptidase